MEYLRNLQPQSIAYFFIYSAKLLPKEAYEEKTRTFPVQAVDTFFESIGELKLDPTAPRQNSARLMTVYLWNNFSLRSYAGHKCEFMQHSTLSVRMYVCVCVCARMHVYASRRFIRIFSS